MCSDRLHLMLLLSNLTGFCLWSHTPTILVLMWNKGVGFLTNHCVDVNYYEVLVLCAFRPAWDFCQKEWKWLLSVSSHLLPYSQLSCFLSKVDIYILSHMFISAVNRKVKGSVSFFTPNWTNNWLITFYKSGTTSYCDASKHSSFAFSHCWTEFTKICIKHFEEKSEGNKNDSLHTVRSSQCPECGLWARAWRWVRTANGKKSC